MFSKNMVVFTAVSGLAVQALHDSAVTHCSCTFACGTRVARQCRHTLQLHISVEVTHIYCVEIFPSFSSRYLTQGICHEGSVRP